jgi:hypothetical protein
MPTSRADRRLPSILRKRATTPGERRAAFDALVSYLGLSLEQLAELEEGPRNAAIARALMELMPAFRPPAGGASRIDFGLFVDDWAKISGGPPGLLADPTSFYQALFVRAINQICEQRKWRQRMKAFRWLAFEDEKIGGESEAQRRRHLLPTLFQNRKTSRSLKHAFDLIPKEIRDHPERHLPEPGNARRTGSANWLRG